MFALNQDAFGGVKPSADFTEAPLAGGLESLATAHEATFGSSAFVGDVRAYEDYQKQRTALLDKGVALPELKNRFGGIALERSIGSYYSGEESDIDPASMEEYDAKVNEYKAKYPELGLKTTRETWDSRKQEVADAILKEKNRKGTTAGFVSSGVGEVFGQVNSPLNAAAMVVGGELLSGAKAGIVPLLASEAAVQGGATAIDEATGAAAYRQSLGQDGSFGSSATNVAESALGGAVIRGTAHGIVGFAKKRWFNDLPNDPAPPHPDTVEPIMQPKAAPGDLTPEQRYNLSQAFPKMVEPRVASTRVGEARVVSDLEHVQTQLEDWNGPAPHEIEPKIPGTDARFVDDPKSGARFSDDPTTRAALGRLSVDEVARQIDPETFRIYDSLAAKRDAISAELSAPRTDTADYAKMITDANNKVVDITDQLGQRGLSKTKRAALEAERNAAMAERDAIASAPRAGDTPRRAKLREDHAKYDHQMRDLAPVISRAYHQARGQFGGNKAIRDAVDSMVRERRTTMSPAEVASIVDRAKAAHEGKIPKDAEPFRPEPAPSLAERLPPEAIIPGEPLSHALAKQAKHVAKLAEDDNQAFRDSLASLLKDEKGQITIGNHTFNMSDKLEMPNPDGTGSREITIKDLLDELHESDNDLKAIKTCSI